MEPFENNSEWMSGLVRAGHPEIRDGEIFLGIHMLPYLPGWKPVRLGAVTEHGTYPVFVARATVQAAIDLNQRMIDEWKQLLKDGDECELQEQNNEP